MKYVVGMVVLTAVILSSSFAQVVEEAENKNEERYRKAMAVVMERLEKKAGVAFDAPPPQVRFRVPPDIDPIRFKGRYDPENNTIELNPILELCDLKELTGPLLDNDTRSDHEDTSGCGAIADMRDLLGHELGHYLTDLITERQFSDSWLMEAKRNGQKEIRFEDPLGIPIVVEGIGVYFGRMALGESAPYFDERAWDEPFVAKDLENYNTMGYLVYYGGCALVKPIIDRYGMRGIAYMVSHPLSITLPDFTEVREYRKRALRELSMATRTASE